MDYQLAKSLKDSGFPQNGVGITGSYYKGDPQFDDTEDINYWVKVPTLSELIEACGDKLALVGQQDGYWCVYDKWYLPGAISNSVTKSRTPIEAVAKFYLAIHTPKPEQP